LRSKHYGILGPFVSYKENVSAANTAPRSSGKCYIKNLPGGLGSSIDEKESTSSPNVAIVVTSFSNASPVKDRLHERFVVAKTFATATALAFAHREA
jgi:hypothetical protein